MILSGLARLSERRPPPKMVRRDLNLLFKGVEQTLDKAVFTAFFAGPAAVIGLINICLSWPVKTRRGVPGRNLAILCEYALREDTARHPTKPTASTPTCAASASPELR